MAKGQLSWNHLANGRVGRIRGHIQPCLELQLSSVDHLDFGNLHRDDNAAGGDGRLRWKSNDRVALWGINIKESVKNG
jgi:hypothetical protein